MTKRSDDPEQDDPELASMRAVWISMRDEAPPAAGLGSLLAAARAKADQLRPSPWWQRAWMVLRRPPVLALATVTVLIAGGLVVSQRRTDLEAAAPTAPTPPMVEPSSMESTVGTQAQGDLRLERAQAAAKDVPAALPSVTKRIVEEEGTRRPTDEAGGSAPPPNAGSGPSAHVGQTADKEAGRDRRTLGPAEADAKLKVTTVRGGDQDPRRVEPEAPNKPTVNKSAADDAKDPKLPGRDTQGSLEIADDGLPVDQVLDGVARTAGTQPDRVTTRPPVQTTRDGAPTSDARAVPSAQLVRQCLVAAARGDCPAVRAMADRLKRTDPTVWKSQILGTPAIARCL